MLPTTLESLLHFLDGKNPIEIKDIRARSIEVTDGLRAKIRSEDLQLQIAKSDERFWVTISQIEISFSHLPDLIKHINEIM